MVAKPPVSDPSLPSVPLPVFGGGLRLRHPDLNNLTRGTGFFGPATMKKVNGGRARHVILWYSVAMKFTEATEKAIPILKSYDIARASIFGSVARDEARHDSDVDLLVELGTPMGMLTYSKMIDQLEESLGTSVDVVTDKSINRFLKPYIMKDLRLIYEK